MSENQKPFVLSKVVATYAAIREQVFIVNEASKNKEEVQGIAKKDNVSLGLVIVPLIGFAAMVYAVATL